MSWLGILHVTYSRSMESYESICCNPKQNHWYCVLERYIFFQPICFSSKNYFFSKTFSGSKLEPPMTSKIAFINSSEPGKCSNATTRNLKTSDFDGFWTQNSAIFGPKTIKNNLIIGGFGQFPGSDEFITAIFEVFGGSNLNPEKVLEKKYFFEEKQMD